MGETEWEAGHLVLNANWNTPNKRQGVPEVLKQIDGFIKNKNFSLSDWGCSKGIKSHKSQKNLSLEPSLAVGNWGETKSWLRKWPILTLEEVCVCRTDQRNAHIKLVKQYCILFSDKRKTWWDGTPRIRENGWLGIRPLLLAKNDTPYWTEVSELWEVYKAEVQSRRAAKLAKAVARAPKECCALSFCPWNQTRWESELPP